MWQNIQQSFKRHEKIHSGNKPFNCSLCDFKCFTSSDLQIHERIHTGVKPFSCPHCEYKCSTSRNLAVHQRTHTGKKENMVLFDTIFPNLLLTKRIFVPNSYMQFFLRSSSFLLTFQTISKKGWVETPFFSFWSLFLKRLH